MFNYCYCILLFELLIMISKKNLGIIDKYKIHREALGKSVNTIKTDVNALKKLCKSLKSMSFENATEDDMESFFINEKNFVLRDHYASRIICFYKWLLKLDDDVRPPCMNWYRYSKSSERERQIDPHVKAKYLEAEEYAKIIQSVKMDLRMSALYETLYLSGARPDEVCKMRIKDVINEDGKISIIVVDSKTIPRPIPLTEQPNFLLRWVENHPHKDNMDAWLFPSLDRRFTGRHIKAASLSDKFNLMVKRLGLKPTLILYSFRKTRATIMFNQAYDDGEMGMLFGWKPHTVIERRKEYDLRGLDDLKAKIFKKAEVYKTREQLVKQVDNISDLQEQVFCLNMLIKAIVESNNIKLNDEDIKKPEIQKVLNTEYHFHLKD